MWNRLQLERLQEEAKVKLREDMERRRQVALRRRDQNIESRRHMDALKRGQQMSRPWIFSYYVVWPKESYMKYLYSIIHT